MTLNTTRNRLTLPALIASAMLAVVAWLVQRITADNQRRQQGEMLSAVLETSHQAVNSWSRAHLYQVGRLWMRALWRRSQRSIMTWAGFGRLRDNFFPPVRILHPWPFKRFDVRT